MDIILPKKFILNHVALLNSENIVENVIIIPESESKSFKQYILKLGFSQNCLLCDQRDYRGKNKIDKSLNAFRKNYPLKGYVYDPISDSFLEPKPIEYPSWILDSDGGYWKPPVDKPIGGLNQGMKYQWDESSVSWIQVPL